MTEVPYGIKITHWTPANDPPLTLNHEHLLHKHGNLQIMTRPSLKNHNIAPHPWRTSHQETSIQRTSYIGVTKPFQVVNAPQPGTVSVLPKSLSPWPNKILTMCSSQRNGMTTAKSSYVTLTHISLPKPWRSPTSQDFYKQRPTSNSDTQSPSKGITYTHMIFGLSLAPSATQPVTYHEPLTLTTDIYHHLSPKYDAFLHEHCDITSSHMDIVTFEKWQHA